ncbi:MAG: hypothetical protein H6673_01520 [Anaerolineales bacterium]|nr:hypothetical protein [Anaerolineales bacterium]
MRFLEGPAGTGKTTTAITHLSHLLMNGERPQSILVLVPQRTLGRPYQLALNQQPNAAGVDVVTIGGLARRSLERFWPLIAEQAGYPRSEPTFLTIETAQYHMAQFIDTAIQTGRFDSVSVPRARLIAQTLDNLSKAAINNFSLAEVTERLTGAWSGHSSRHMVYETWQTTVEQFRAYCQEHNLLDFSIQIELFTQHILNDPQIAAHLRDTYQHLIADNIEENNPIALDFIHWLWPSLDSALLIYDSDAGYRIFLGAEPEAAYSLQTLCDEHEALTTSRVQSPALQNLEQAITNAFTNEPQAQSSLVQEAFTFTFHSFYPQMLDWVCEQVIDLVERQNVEPREIVLIAPFLNDSLRFSIMNTLENAGIPIISHRPSRAIREEPIARALLTLMQWVNPVEPSLPPAADMANALEQLIDGLDPIRARILTEIVYGSAGRRELGSFDDINPKMQSRITYICGERYEQLRQWLIDMRTTVSEIPPDHFLRSLFGDIASQVGFGLHRQMDSGTVAAQLIDSAFDFRTSLYPEGTDDWAPVWRDYRELVSEGLLAAFHPLSWQKEETNAVFIAPAYTYLMRNRPVEYQFWLDVGSQAWGERLEQPLTHPYVLRRDYPLHRVWTDEDEQQSNWATLYKLMVGLVRRCRKQIYLAIADLGEQGFEQRGPLLHVFQQILQQDEA